MFKKLIEKSKTLLLLGRYNYPTGAFLLMWPCFWGVVYEINLEKNILLTLFLLAIGSLTMRGAGCCINDFFDKDFDKKVLRTKNRPLAKGILSKKEAIIFIFFQMIIGLMIVIQFNIKVILFSFAIIPLIIIYPLFKRITDYPQIILGLIFNWGIIVGFLTQNPELSLGTLFLYFGGFFLTIGYDTIYGFQDIRDDKRIGVKSLSLKQEKKPKYFVFLIYLVSQIFFTIAFLIKSSNLFASLLLSLILFFCISWQYYAFTQKIPLKKIFDFNAYQGGIIFLIIFSLNYL